MTTETIPPSKLFGPSRLSRVALESTCDRRTVAAYLDGQTIRPSSAERIADALRASGYARLVRADLAGAIAPDKDSATK